MNKIKFILLNVWLSVVTASAYAQIESEIKKYEEANIAVNYQGEIGSFLQLLSAKLGIGYYNENIDPLVKIKVKQDKDKSLSHLIMLLNSQLKTQHVLLDGFNDKVTLALLSKNQEILQSPKYIGEINFNNSSQVFNMPESIESVGGTLSNIENVQVLDKDATKIEELLKEQEEKMNNIVTLSQNEKLIKRYKRSPPQYKIENKEAVKLETIRSTKISTFLVFQNGVDVKDYQIEGKFQDIAKLGNLVAILHRQKEPPSTIKIFDGNNKGVVIHKIN